MFLLPNITHLASSMESYLVMTTAWSKRSPWTEVCYLWLNLLQAGVTGELTACHDHHSVRFGKRWQKLCQKLKSWQQIRSNITASWWYLFFCLVSPADMWPKHQKDIPPGCCNRWLTSIWQDQRRRLWSVTRSSSSSASLSFLSFLTCIFSKFLVIRYHCCAIVWYLSMFNYIFYTYVLIFDMWSEVWQIEKLVQKSCMY